MFQSRSSGGVVNVNGVKKSFERTIECSNEGLYLH